MFFNEHFGFLMLNTDQIKTQMKTNVLMMLTFVCLCSV